MARKGFTWHAPQAPVFPPEWGEILRFPARYGTVTLAQAEAAGYGDPEEAILGAATEDADNEGLPTDPAELEAFQLAWFGPSTPPSDLVELTDPITGKSLIAIDPSNPLGGGCQGEANLWLRGEAPESGVTDADITDHVDYARVWIDSQIRTAFRAALLDDRTTEVVDEWRTCMTDHGWSTERWQYPGGLVVVESGQPPGSEAEEAYDTSDTVDVERAVTDVQCQLGIDWVERLRGVEREYQQETVERVPDLFADVKALISAYEQRLEGLRLGDLDD